MKKSVYIDIIRIAFSGELLLTTKLLNEKERTPNKRGEYHKEISMNTTLHIIYNSFIFIALIVNNSAAIHNKHFGNDYILNLGLVECRKQKDIFVMAKWKLFIL